MSTLDSSQTGLRESRRFEFRRCLGRGGFGEVYLAAMTSPGGVRADVAVKVLLRELDPRSQPVERLREEGKLLGLLNHPGILSVHDIVLLDGRVALVTEYVPGGDLDECIVGDDPISARALVEVVGVVADALDSAWNTPGPDGPLRLVHRDIKPSNIRIGVHGQVKLLDFGIAKARDAERGVKTQTDAVMGSVLFMAPERFHTGDAGPASDVYGLGAVFFEGLSRAHLYEGVTIKQQLGLCFDRDRHDAFITSRLATLVAADAALVRLVRRMLAFEATDRPTPSEVAHACDELAERLGDQPLRRWVRDRTWPVPADFTGPLDGQVLTESSLATGEISRAVREARADATPVAAAPRRSSSALFIAVGLVGALVAVGAVVVVAGLAGGLWWFSPGSGQSADVAPPATVVVPAPAEPVAAEVPVEAAPELDPPDPPALVAEPPKPGVARKDPAAAPPKSESTPEPAPPARVASGNVIVQGDASEVTLVGAGGSRSAGAVPVGTWRARATFANGSRVDTSPFEVRDGATVVVRCVAGFQRCSVRE